MSSMTRRISVWRARVKKRGISGGHKIQSHHDIGIIAPPAGPVQRDAIGFLLHFQFELSIFQVPKP